MKVFIITLIITMMALLGFSLVISFCKKRSRQSRHPLTGMCHKSGGEVCAACNGQEKNKSASP